MLFIKFIFRIKQKYKLSYGQISRTGRTPRVSDRICLKTSLCFEVSSSYNSQTFFKGRHPINVYLTSWGFFLCCLHPPQWWRRLTAALWRSKFTWGVFCTWPASIVHDFFYNNSIKPLQAEARGISAHSSNLGTGLWNSQQPAGDK